MKVNLLKSVTAQLLATVGLVVFSPRNPLAQDSPAFLAEGPPEVRLTISGINSSGISLKLESFGTLNYLIEATTNLVEWHRTNADLTTVRLDAVGRFPLWIYIDKWRNVSDDDIS